MLSKQMGFNGCRKHQKVEDPRFLYHADKLGFIVWGEMANCANYDDTTINKMKNENPLGSAPVSKLMLKFAVPSIIGMLVGSLYNIVDQLFIGHAVGINGKVFTDHFIGYHAEDPCRVHSVVESLVKFTVVLNMQKIRSVLQ